ncbi:hypothetical protein SETIT_4G004400v2 [Setaria italica]|uniref:DUF1618 domain-containing protein n=1 Tax=Setaria italica TaxID=4555 RepID=A0A368QPH5_SETIT|nr:hypothetical protein SETIT_4G004400v2 [Setaria italica]
MVRVKEASFHPPALDACGDDEEEIPSVLIEFKAYVADRRNEPTADLIDGNDFYIYQPAGGDGPSLTRLPRPPGDVILDTHRVGILSCPANDHDGSTGLSLLRPHRPRQEKFYMVAALCDDESALGRGRFVLYVYNSKLQAWTATNVSVEDQHFRKYQDQGYFLHFNTRAIAVGGEDATIAFVDLWKGILLCDLSHVKDKPWLRYVPLPRPSGSPRLGDAYRSRDIAVVDGHFKFVRARDEWTDCPTCGSDEFYSWRSTVWTRPVSASSLLDDSWQLVCDMHGFLWDEWPAWVIAVDMMNNRLPGVAGFDAQRYVATGFGYLHSRISKYLKKTPDVLFCYLQVQRKKLKRPGGMLLAGSSKGWCFCGWRGHYRKE